MDVDIEFQLKKLSLKLRVDILKSVYLAKSGHPGGSLSCVDILIYLYKYVLNVHADSLKDENRDRFVLSKGHGAPALYAVLAELGFFDSSELLKLRKLGSMLQGHPNMNTTPGVDMSTGSLGQGISAACGMALGLRLNESSARVYCLLGDGELQEGQVFEAFCFAAHQKLDNLCFIVDNNGLQIDGTIEEVAGFFNLKEKFKAFGLEVLDVDGHNFSDICRAFEKAKQIKGKPSIILAKTRKGEGVYFMEGQASWHGKAPNGKEYELAVGCLREKLKELEGV